MDSEDRIRWLLSVKMQIKEILVRRDLIFFVDECTFSPKSYTTLVYQKKG